MRFIEGIISKAWTGGIALLCLQGMVSCQDKVDSSDLYTFVGQTVSSYLASNPDYSEFYNVLQKSRVTDKSETRLSELLSTRGHYTCFAPDNDAMKMYLDSIYNHKPYTTDTMSETTANRIALNCIIDNGDNAAYLSTMFAVGALFDATLSDRFVMTTFDTIPGGKTVTIINNSSKIIMPDVTVENGVVHGVNRVLSPSTVTLPALLGQVANMRIFSHLLELTSWSDSMQLYRDEDYEANHPLEGPNTSSVKRGTYIASPKHRYHGYTAFVEPDSVYFKQWGVPMPVVVNGQVTNWNEIMAVINEKCKVAYPNAASDDPTSRECALNQFVSYHLLPARVPYNLLVHHFDEMNYNPKMPENLTIDIWEYYVPMGWPHRLLKITQPAKTGTMNINRHSTYDNSFFGTYQETDCDREGTIISPSNGNITNNALNGYYYPLNEILLYDNDVPNKVLNERIRFDVEAMMPELMTNNIRCAVAGAWCFLPSGYMENLSISDETYVNYGNQMSSYTGSGFRDYQGDEIQIAGQYDFIFKLLPVPYSGTYELRYGMSNNNMRGMAQVYFGTNKKNLTAIGLPLDLRIASSNSAIGWADDDETDEEVNIENDKAMKNRGYMKGPKSYCLGAMSGAMTTPFRSASGSQPALRKVLWTGHMDPNTVYYIRIKSVLESTVAQMMFDYFELVPKSVYNGTVAEDVW